jgi:hypothetical protein
MRVYEMHRPKPDSSRLQIGRREEGRVLLQTEAKYGEEIMNRTQSE